MKKYFKKSGIVVAAAVVFAMVLTFTSPALAGGNTFWDDSTTQWLSGQPNSASAALSDAPCDPAQVKRGGLSFLP